MGDAAAPAAFDIEAQRTQIRPAQEETNKFVAEQHKLMAEAAELSRDRALAPCQVALSGMAAGAAFFGAGAAFIKLLGAWRASPDGTAAPKASPSQAARLADRKAPKPTSNAPTGNAATAAS